MSNGEKFILSAAMTLMPIPDAVDVNVGLWAVDEEVGFTAKMKLNRKSERKNCNNGGEIIALRFKYSHS